ncbi:MAG: hypothetical protein RIR26_1801 [Pseudomonadota bacterium]|jgi:hypothetical protein
MANIPNKKNSHLTDRREFIRRMSIAGGGVVLLGGTDGLLGRAMRAVAEPVAQAENPHFLLHIAIDGGWSPTYMFDSRPREFRAAGLWENYHDASAELGTWTDKKGRTSWVSPSMSALKECFLTNPCFSVVKGLHISADFDGHLENLRLLLTGSTTGGEYLGVALNESGRARQKGAPLDYLKMGPELFGANLSGGTELAMSVSLGRALRTMAGGGATGSSRVAANAAELMRGVYADAARSGGLGGRGAAQFAAAAQESVALKALLSRLDFEGLDDNSASLVGPVKLALRSFAAGLGHVALVGGLPNGLRLGNGGDINLDTHSGDSAALQPQAYAVIAEDLAKVFRLLRETPYDAGRALSFLDVTTVLVTSEFGRTNRQTSASIDKTGTDHNRFGNMALVGGKGIEPGLFLGATDLDSLTKDDNGTSMFVAPSAAHLRIDRTQVMPMGHVYDFTTARVVTDARPEDYRQLDYLTSGSLVNSIYSLFDVPESRWRAQAGRGGSVGERFPVISELLRKS